MTKGERLVWAAAFVKYDDINSPPPHVIRGNAAQWAAWELDQTVCAVEAACGVVTRLRACEAAVLDGFGECDVVQMYREALQEAEDGNGA
jgi:hypothetical protein